ncbi:MAG: hypothetical protein B6229_02090 [Spirochaetaceae bacterium 4572_7]|nr:MAG: hypothetical protein B6229_02090 [Spirochaetaceae bacterium 4572_7]
MSIFSYIIMIAMLLSAFRAITAIKLIDSIFFFTFIGIGATILFALMKAPDVALTEAAVGTGLVTLIFLSTLRKTSKEDESES